MLRFQTSITIGRNVPDGSFVTDDMVDAFIADTVAPHLPDGFTITTAQGGWRDMETFQTIREPSIVITVAHDGGRAINERIARVASAAKSRFRQQAVMVADVPASVRFI